jgi:hypothetical protein
MYNQGSVPGIEFYQEEFIDLSSAYKIFVCLTFTNGNSRTYRVKRVRAYRLGTVYEYKVRYSKSVKTWRRCITPKGYIIPVIDGKFVIPQNEGSETPAYPKESVPIPQIVVGEDGKLRFDRVGTGYEEFDLLMNTHLKAETARTIKGGVNVPWLWLIIGVAIVIIAIVGINMFRGTSNPGTSATPVPTGQAFTPLGGK